MKVNSKLMGIIVVIIVFGGIGISKITGSWKTESSKIPVKYSSGNFEGEFNPEDIRGSYSFQDINNSFEVPIDDLATAFGVNTIDNVAAFKVKELENIYASLKDLQTEIGTSSVKYFVALYKELPYEISEEVFLPKSAVDMLISLEKLTEEDREYLIQHSVDISNVSVDNIAEENDIENEFLVKGKTSFKEIINLGVSKEYIEELIEEEIPSLTMTVRDYCVQNEIEFLELKLKFQQKIDELHK